MMLLGRFFCLISPIDTVLLIGYARLMFFLQRSKRFVEWMLFKPFAQFENLLRSFILKFFIILPLVAEAKKNDRLLVIFEVLGGLLLCSSIRRFQRLQLLHFIFVDRVSFLKRLAATYRSKHEKKQHPSHFFVALFPIF